MTQHFGILKKLTVVILLLASLLVVFSGSSTYAQNDNSINVDSNLIGGLFGDLVATRKLDQKDCAERVRQLSPNDNHIKKIFDDVKVKFKLEKPVSIAFLRKLSQEVFSTSGETSDPAHFAYAIKDGNCNGKFKGRLMLIGDLLLKFADSEKEKDLTMAAVMAHEAAHFKQDEKGNPLWRKEMELHADFLAGWYVSIYTAEKYGDKRKNNSRQDIDLKREKLAPHLKAMGTFYYLGEGSKSKPSARYGTPENRLQILLEGYQTTAAEIDSAFEVGKQVIAQNPIFQNPKS
jgi:hypothetical protein